MGAMTSTAEYRDGSDVLREAATGLAAVMERPPVRC